MVGAILEEEDSMQVSELMTPNPITVEHTVTIREAMGLLHEYDMRHLPVVDEDSLRGMLSDRDVRRYMPALTPDEDYEPLAVERLDDPVSAAMRGTVATVNPEDDISAAIDLMVDWKIGAIPVIEEGSDRKLVGIVSYVDVLRAARGTL